MCCTPALDDIPNIYGVYLLLSIVSLRNTIPTPLTPPQMLLADSTAIFR
jgi:hypothetical protein